MSEDKSLITIVSAVVITALIVGGVVYSMQNSKSKDLQKNIDDLKTQVQTSQAQAQNNQEAQNKIAELENQIVGLQKKAVENENKQNADTGNQVNEGVKEPELTRETALSLLKKDLPYECLSKGIGEKYGTCVVDISKTNNQWAVIVTYDKLADDSIKAERVKTVITNKDGKWVKGSISKDQRCQLNRGHQDFSTALCI